MSDEYTTGSSIMPQKKNPDAAELARGMSGFVAGNFIQNLMTLKSLPLGYNRDLQEDRVLLWESIRKTDLVLKVLAGVVSTARFDEKRMAELAGANFSTATELANYLVREKKLPFRNAHDITAKVVKDLHSKKKDFSDLELTAKMLKKQGVNMPSQQLRHILDPKAAVSASRSLGGTSPREVVRMTRELSKSLSAAEKSIRDRRNRINAARKLTADAATRLA
jgi:argininosuccinate lyase